MAKHCSRQHNQEVCLEDIFNHLWLYSDPVLRKLGAKKSPQNVNYVSKNELKNELSPDNIKLNQFIVKEE